MAKADGDLKSKYRLEDNNTIVFTDPVFCYYDGAKYYLNLVHYYPNKYFVEMDKLSEKYFFIFDKVYDYTAASNNTMAYGGGLIGAVVAGAEATNKSPAIIDKETGKMVSFTKRTMELFLGTEYENYALYVKEDNREKIVQIFKEIIENAAQRNRLLSLDL